MFNFAPVIPARSDLDWCWFLRRYGKSGDMLERALHDIGVMDPGGWAPWGRSQMTATGAPVEVTFSTGKTDFILITEVGDPASDKAARLHQVCAVIRDLSGDKIDPARRDVISAAQSSGLSFGARLGLSAERDGLRCTLIAELPETGADVAQLLYKKTALDGATTAKPSTLALDATSGDMTLYFANADLGPFLKAAGMASDTFEKTKITTRPALVSVTINKAGAIKTVSQHFNASDLFRSDLKATRYLRDQKALADSGYHALVDHLPPSTGGAMAHNTISLTTDGKTTRLQVSVAAPWGCMVDDF